MKFSTTVAVTALATLSTAQSDNATTCADGAHVIVARASREDPGYGVLEVVKDEILVRVEDSNAVAVPYPAVIEQPPLYFASVGEGVGNMTELIEEYIDACPDGRVVLMGYSQGAQVVGDTLLGNATSAFPASPGLDEKYLPNIAAIVLMGDPTNLANYTFLVGNSTKSGLFPRQNGAGWAQKGLTDKVVSYCDTGDTYCDSGTPGVEGSRVHGSYVEVYGTDAGDFVVEKLAANESTTPSSTSAPSGPSATASSSASPPTYTGAASVLGVPSTYGLFAGVIGSVMAFTLI